MQRICKEDTDDTVDVLAKSINAGFSTLAGAISMGSKKSLRLRTVKQIILLGEHAGSIDEPPDIKANKSVAKSFNAEYAHTSALTGEGNVLCKSASRKNNFTGVNKLFQMVAELYAAALRDQESFLF